MNSVGNVSSGPRIETVHVNTSRRAERLKITPELTDNSPAAEFVPESESVCSCAKF
jgi:hypothetical protein